MLVNRILKHGKKSLAYQIIYRAVKKIQQKTEANPLSVLRQAILGVTPDIAVKARRVGGSTHQVPIEIGSTQGKAFAIRWLLGASRKRPGRCYRKTVVLGIRLPSTMFCVPGEGSYIFMSLAKGEAALSKVLEIKKDSQKNMSACIFSKKKLLHLTRKYTFVRNYFILRYYTCNNFRV
ncbi:hypothetical protein KSP40_PGU022058 [Platanthera guangdongensis]|uniref:30S ribosomal protein S7, chloroplastic n=1 Tax=Platanthera guangdongensis TaxID=2320717 RepID=A0ABR2MXA0_9ASPA